MLYPEKGSGFEKGVLTLKVGGAVSVWGGLYQLWGAALREGVPTTVKKGPALKRTLGGKEGLAEEGWHGGRGSESTGARRGAVGSRGTCAVEVPPSRGAGWRAGPGCVWREQGSHPAQEREDSRPYSPRLPAKPSILRGKRRAPGSAGRALHSADRLGSPTLSLTR